MLRTDASIVFQGVSAIMLLARTDKIRVFETYPRIVEILLANDRLQLGQQYPSGENIPRALLFSPHNTCAPPRSLRATNTFFNKEYLLQCLEIEYINVIPQGECDYVVRGEAVAGGADSGHYYPTWTCTSTVSECKHLERLRTDERLLEDAYEVYRKGGVVEKSEILADCSSDDCSSDDGNEMACFFNKEYQWLYNGRNKAFNDFLQSVNDCRWKSVKLWPDVIFWFDDACTPRKVTFAHSSVLWEYNPLVWKALIPNIPGKSDFMLVIKAPCRSMELFNYVLQFAYTGVLGHQEAMVEDATSLCGATYVFDFSGPLFVLANELQDTVLMKYLCTTAKQHQSQTSSFALRAVTNSFPEREAVEWYLIGQRWDGKDAPWELRCPHINPLGNFCIHACTAWLNRNPKNDLLRGIPAGVIGLALATSTEFHRHRDEELALTSSTRTTECTACLFEHWCESNWDIISHDSAQAAYLLEVMQLVVETTSPSFVRKQIFNLPECNGRGLFALDPPSRPSLLARACVRLSGKAEALARRLFVAAQLDHYEHEEEAEGGEQQRSSDGIQYARFYFHRLTDIVSNLSSDGSVVAGKPGCLMVTHPGYLKLLLIPNGSRADCGVVREGEAAASFLLDNPATIGARTVTWKQMQLPNALSYAVSVHGVSLHNNPDMVVLFGVVTQMQHCSTFADDSPASCHERKKRRGGGVSSGWVCKLLAVNGKSMQTMDMACGLAGLYDSIYTCSSVRWACWCVSHSFIVGRRRDNGAVQVHFGRDGGGGDGIETDGLDHKQDDDRVSAGQADFLEHKCANAVSAATVVYNSILTLTCNCICIANYPNNNDSHGVSGRMRTSRPVIVICANDGTVYTIDAACSRVAKDSQTQLPPGPVSVCCKDDAASEFTVVYQESICVMRLTAAVASDGQTGCSSGEELEVEILYTVNTSGYFSPCDVHIPRTTRGGKNSCKSPSSYNNKQPRALNTIGGCSSDNGILYVIDSSNILSVFGCTKETQTKLGGAIEGASAGVHVGLLEQHHKGCKQDSKRWKTFRDLLLAS